MSDQLYKQVELEYIGGGRREISWIKSEIAIPNKTVKLDKEKRLARIHNVYPTLLTAEQVGINQKYPLRKATDI